MTTTQINSTATLSSTNTTSAVTSQITNPAFFGYASQSLIAGTVVYASENCPAPSTYVSSSNYVTCCSDSCTPFTGCLSGSTLIGPSKTQACSPSLTCKTDSVFATQGVQANLAVYCGEGFGTNWYRILPSDGIDSSNTSAINAAQTSNHINPLGGPVGGSIGGVFFLIVLAGIVYCFSCGCRGGGGGGGGRSSGYDPQQEQEWQRQDNERVRQWGIQEADERRRQGDN